MGTHIGAQKHANCFDQVFLHHRQTWSRGTEDRKDACEDSE